MKRDDTFDIFVRAGEKSDAPDIHKLAQLMSSDEISLDETITKLIHLTQSSNDHVFVATIDAKIVGWIHILKATRLTSHEFYEIAGLIVHPDWRKKSVGTALIDYGLDHFPGKWRVRCREDRDSSLKFYRALDFTPTKKQIVLDYFED